MGRFSNQAQLTYKDSVMKSNIVIGEILGAVTASKISLLSRYRQGDIITYVISIINSGDIELTNLTVTDNQGEYTFGTQKRYPLSYIPESLRYYTNGTIQNTPVVEGTDILEVRNIRVPSKGNATLIYQTEINEYAPLGTADMITNKASITGESPAVTVSAEATIWSLDEPKLTITKNISPTTIVENGMLTYTFTIQNFGNTDAVLDDNILLNDTFDPKLRNIAVSFNGQPWTADTHYTYNTETGVFASKDNRITVPKATFTQNAVTGTWSITPGASVLVVTGNIV